MEISSEYTSSVYATKAISYAAPTSSTSSVSRGGDTVSISEEARQMFSQMMQKYNTSNNSEDAIMPSGGESTSSSVQHSEGTVDGQVSAAVQGHGDAGGSDAAGAQGQGGGGGGGASEASSTESEIEELEAQIASLTAQLSSLPAGDSKASSINSQIAALQAQMQTLKSQSA